AGRGDGGGDLGHRGADLVVGEVEPSLRGRGVGDGSGDGTVLVVREPDADAGSLEGRTCVVDRDCWSGCRLDLLRRGRGLGRGAGPEEAGDDNPDDEHRSSDSRENHGAALRSGRGRRHQLAASNSMLTAVGATPARIAPTTPPIARALPRLAPP